MGTALRTAGAAGEAAFAGDEFEEGAGAIRAALAAPDEPVGPETVCPAAAARCAG